ncbi:hypothetical protein ESCO_001947 [Escovopsis weberi]|uniref:PLD phosphodiesterase domain-containing protein n=1 Tax=Escovopsis weberi TaxID=150374 RepID=A0A0M8N8A9_ESCWE|nr:hypothetical protein ESCO_001947 [Escovopsis weberi]
MSSPLVSEIPSSFIVPWRNLLLAHQDARLHDVPNYHCARDIDSLITTSIPRSLVVGTGHSIFSRAILPAIAAAQRSIHFVTCFWAASPSLDGLREALLELAASRCGPQHGEPLPPTLHVSIGFSSRGLFQKLLHPSSFDGHLYPPRDWPKLGLPDEKALRRGGIEMTVKSLFFTPFSVLHPKYIIVDGRSAWVPSCNVSWERWFEGCIELEGNVVDALIGFHARVWGRKPDDVTDATHEPGVDMNERRAGDQTRGGGGDGSDDGDDEMTDSATSNEEGRRGHDRMQSAAQAVCLSGSRPIPTVLLPSPHHRNPRFRFLFLFSRADPPMTPLNAALLTLFANAQRDIRIVTPNVTSWPVLEALLAALSRGVNVQIRTSRNLMLLEQLLTAGTTTSWCLKKLIRRYWKLTDRGHQPADLEAQPVSPGRLEIFYYRQLGRRAGKDDEPVASHLKMTMVDDEYLVLGSGNLDRASWYTSQELGLLFYMPGFEERSLWETVLEQRAQVLFRSGHY